MVTRLASGFSLVETVITSALLALLCLALIQTNLQLLTFANIEEQDIQKRALRASIEHIQLFDSIQLDEFNISVESETLVISDKDHDGVDETWEKADENIINAESSSLLSKKLITVTYADGDSDTVQGNPP